MSVQTTLDAWIARDTIPFTIDSPVSIDGAVDRIVASLGDSVELLGIGEALHGSDLPLGEGGLASPSRVLELVLGYLDVVDRASASMHRERIIALVGDAAQWERPAAMFDPAQSIGRSARATELRFATLDIITE